MSLLPVELLDAGVRCGELKQRGDTVAVAEGSGGGLVSAALLAVPGASAKVERPGRQATRTSDGGGRISRAPHG